MPHATLNIYVRPLYVHPFSASLMIVEIHATSARRIHFKRSCPPITSAIIPGTHKILIAPQEVRVRADRVETGKRDQGHIP